MARPRAGRWRPPLYAGVRIAPAHFLKARAMMPVDSVEAPLSAALAAATSVASRGSRGWS
eukprot:CAMPEP_0202059402 /NCGR_PEP_ID=MMETSP0963-20130614/35076_1 /ASSEMBLY_ACC=CAM_ASM_000494 /TAXON_ID=4773 /ORGANISM="Schizochytrium aggregatum, Strain ATCC28209" /LENGTH=59 /DNA_ID=CAMNT_0048625439 /DNA_START=33 /DNA_END=209 /DNA_ORIENTATION=+